MLTGPEHWAEQAKKAFAWANANEGGLSLITFFATLFLGWISGIFGGLIKKPKLMLKTIEGPTFCCTFGTGNKYLAYDVHRTGFAIYLHVTNIGSAAATLETIEIGYRWCITPLKPLWWKYGLFRFWLTEQATSLEDFQVSIGEHQKVFPFMTQRSALSGTSAETFLEVGRSTNGVVYFEQSDSWGACFPRSINGDVSIRIRLRDSFSRSYSRKISIRKISLQEARVYNPSFGLTLSSLRGEQDPVDLPTDQNGNLVAPAD